MDQDLFVENDHVNEKNEERCIELACESIYLLCSVINNEVDETKDILKENRKNLSSLVIKL